MSEFKGFSPRTIDFMWDIRLNNNKAWFTENKQRYVDDFYNPMKALCNSVWEKMNRDFPGYGFAGKTSRIYRDARRVRDGCPYRDLLWFTVAKPDVDWGAAPGFWFELAPENWMYGMGLFPDSAGMAKVRARIDRNPKKFARVFEALGTQEEFMLGGDEYARKKPAPSEETAQFYNKKHLSFTHHEKNSKVLYSPQFADRIAGGWKFLMQFYDYLAGIHADPAP